MNLEVQVQLFLTRNTTKNQKNSICKMMLYKKKHLVDRLYTRSAKCFFI